MDLKIGIFCDAFRPENKAVAVRMFHLADAFSKKGFDVVVQTSTRSASTTNSSIKVKQNIISAPSNGDSNLKRLAGELLLGTEMFWRILLSRYRIVLLTSPPFIACCLASWAARIRRIPYVFDVRDEYPEVFITSGLLREKSILGRVLLALERSVYNHALMVCSVTEGICSRINDKLTSVKKKAVLLRNGFDADRFKPSTEKENILTIIFHGNIGKFQDPELILLLATKAQDAKIPVQFKIIGWGNNDTALKKNIPSNVEYMGMLDYENVPDVISKAHLGISCRSNDLISKNSFPVKLYEYIGVGIPMIVTPRSEAGNFVEKHAIGFQFDPEELDAILAKILLFTSDRQALQKLSSRISVVRDSFSRHIIAEAFADSVKVKLLSIQSV
jgi:glycosyltransferase involved in cell wall biosynthesis